MKNKKKPESESIPEFEKSMDNLSQERKDYIDNSMKIAELQSALNAEIFAHQLTKNILSQTITKPNISGSVSEFERDLYNLINMYVGAGLTKVDLVLKMEYVTQSCRVS